MKYRAIQAKSINLYKNTRSKLIKCCANIYFNKPCIAKKFIRKYASIKAQINSNIIMKFVMFD